MTAWLDGQPASRMPLADRGLAYGDGLFETMQVRQGRVPLLDRHLQRLQLGCQRLGLEADLPQLRQEIIAFAATMREGVCKLILTRGDGQRGYAMPQPAVTRRILQAAALPHWPAEHSTQGIHLYPCRTRLAIQPALAGLKHLNRLEQVLARAEWDDPAYAEGLMLDTSGHVIEGVFSNLFMVRDGSLLTPDLSGSGVAGVMRGLVMELARQSGISVHTGNFSMAELADMDEVFTCNSLYGIWPVCSYRQYQWSVGPVTLGLQKNIKGQFS